ncbi:MAG: hypothetical protein BGO55_13585 [Sphingobacteriales bacterium 50-39]|nr:MAG: hypothetical protein BGO55_13585 [Sphingobacteriales bacterium 50-39]
MPIQGRVMNENGEPLSGVSIIEKGTDNGTYSAADGSFSLNVKDENAVLVISNVGFVKSEVSIKNNRTPIILLATLQNNMEEAVVVGYGKQKKISVTGAIASIQTKELKQSPAANLAVSLAGRLPGLTAIQKSGEPGRDITQLFIRGQGTVNVQSPIILVDGIERDLKSIDPNEVESVTILKDASSTAVFGVRGANGVILVTTRRGKSEVPEIGYSFQAGMQDFPNLIKPVNAFDYATLKNLALTNDGLSPAYSDYALERYKLHDDPLRYPDNDWNKINLKKYAFMQRHNLTISGGSKFAKYFVNAGYLGQGGQFRTEPHQPLGYDPAFKLDRYSFRSNIDLQLNKNLSAFLNVAGYVEKVNSPWGATGSNASLYIIAFGNDMPANVPGPLTQKGEILVGSAGQWSQYALINRSGYVKTTSGNITSSYGMEQKLNFITEGLSAKAMVSFDITPVNNLSAARGYESWMQVIDPNLKGADGKDSIYNVPSNAGVNTPLSISGTRSFTSLSNVQASVNYARVFNKHSLSSLLLFQQQSLIINEQLPFNSRGFATRWAYNYDSRYFFEFDAGYNGSEQFAKKRRYGFFPAVSGAWVISKEKFLKDASAIDLLKLRGSYGLVGNDRLGGQRFLYLDDVQLTGGGYSPSLGLGQTVQINLLKNQNLQWEVAKKTDLGLELGLFNSVTLSVDLFRERRDNILRNRGTVPLMNGLPISVLAPVNIGVVENKGYEVELDYQKKFDKDWSFLAKLNMSYARNRQLYADEPLLPPDYAYRYRETGYRIGQQFGYLVDKYFGSEQEIQLSPVQNVGGHTSRPGDFKYRDITGDGVVDQRDMAPILFSSVPEYSFGAALQASYKNFDLSILFQGVTNVSNYYMFRGTNSVSNYVARHLESWTPERASKGLPIEYPRLTTQANPNEIMNNFFINDASYIRLKNAEIGYNLPARMLSRLRIRGIRIFANGFNLMTWDRLPTKNFDPELTGDLSYPIVRIYNFGINVNF